MSLLRHSTRTVSVGHCRSADPSGDRPGTPDRLKPPENEKGHPGTSRVASTLGKSWLLDRERWCGRPRRFPVGGVTRRVRGLARLLRQASGPREISRRTCGEPQCHSPGATLFRTRLFPILFLSSSSQGYHLDFVTGAAKFSGRSPPRVVSLVSRRFSWCAHDTNQTTEAPDLLGVRGTRRVATSTEYHSRASPGRGVGSPAVEGSMSDRSPLPAWVSDPAAPIPIKSAAIHLPLPCRRSAVASHSRSED